MFDVQGTGWILLVALSVLLCSLTIGVATAPAKNVYYPEVSFGEPGTGPGQLDRPMGLAVNDSNPLMEPVAGGDVYVADTGNNRVERFSASGRYEGQFNGSGTYESGGAVKHGAEAPTGTLLAPEEVAVDDSCQEQRPELTGLACTTFDPSAWNVYVTDAGHKAIDEFSSAGEYLGQLTEVERCERQYELPPCTRSKPVAARFAELRNVAVGPTGNLWVFETEAKEEHAFQFGSGTEYHYTTYFGYVDEFSATGVFLRSFRTNRSPSFFEGHVSSPAFAVDANEDVYQAEGLEMKVSQYAANEDSEWMERWSGLGVGVDALALVPSTSSRLANEMLTDVGGELVAQDGELIKHVPTGIERFSSVLLPDESMPPIWLEAFPGEIVPKGYSGLSESYGLAVNTQATAYASESGADQIEAFEYVSVPVVKTDAPSEVGETDLVVHGSADPEGEPVSECYFEVESLEVNSGRSTADVPCEQAIGGKDELLNVGARMAGLPPAEERVIQLVVVTGERVRAPGGKVRIHRPLATHETVDEVGSTTAKVGARIDPGALAGCYWIEYGTSAAYGEVQPTREECVPLESGTDDAAVAIELSGLQANTKYYFRVGASNGLGERDGEGSTFTTFDPSGAELPDGRVAEAVSPVGTGQDPEVYVPGGMENGLDYLGRHGIYTELPFVAAPDGDTVTYLGDPPASGGNGDDGVGGGNQYIARRSAHGGWTQMGVDPPGFANQYAGFASDLSAGVLESPETLSARAPEGYSNLYLRTLGGGAAANGTFANLPGPFDPLILVPPTCPSGGFGAIVSDRLYSTPLFVGGNAGASSLAPYSDLLFEADAGLPSSPSAPEGCDAGNDLYEWAGGRLHLVNMTPEGEVEPYATFGRQGPSNDGFLSPETENVISADGSRIYWSALGARGGWVLIGSEYEERPKALYVRENATRPEAEGGGCSGPGKACTVRLDVAEPGVTQAPSCEPAQAGESSPCEHPYFLTTASDGSRAFFTDEQRLTSGATAEAGSPDLYEYDLDAPEGQRLTDLSIPPAGVACPAPPRGCGHADVQGLVGSGEDGSYVYFVADGILTEGANAEERTPVEGAPNLYLRHGDETTFIATLSNEDDDFTHGTGGHDGDWQADPGHRTAEVAPDGRSVVFMSRNQLTGYENDITLEYGGKQIVKPLTEVFVYDADTHSLVCASCNPSGEAPVPPALPEYTANAEEVWGSFLPVSDSVVGYQPREIADEGDRVFFNSIEPLVPQDENGFVDVYEWEREGSGSCRRAPGCVYLLSGGQSTDNSYLIDASASGNDIFLASRAQLVRADHGDNEVLYDARVGGVEPPAEGECAGTSCQGAPPAAPVFATPASAIFGGTGNFPPSPPEPPPTLLKKTCAKGKRLSGGRCVRAKARHRRGGYKASGKERRGRRSRRHARRSRR